MKWFFTEKVTYLTALIVSLFSTCGITLASHHSTKALVQKVCVLLEAHSGNQGVVIGTSGLVSMVVNLIESDSYSAVNSIALFEGSKVLLDRQFNHKSGYLLSDLSGLTVQSHSKILTYNIRVDIAQKDTLYMLNLFLGLIIGGLVGLIIKTAKVFLAQRQLVITASAISNMAKQVSHDIRSPLSALNMVMEQLTQIPENHRLIIRSSVSRINDIANQLLDKGKSPAIKTGGSSLSNQNLPQLSVQLLFPIIDSLVSEKRMQFRDKQSVVIEANVQKGYGLFANINSIELKRVISNLINNSVEAFLSEKGNIVVSLDCSGDDINLVIEDNGKGIPENILKKLGEIGVSHGKEGTQSGSGLGVYHAKQTVESFGGTFAIESKEGIGTKIKMVFPKAQAPHWFVEKLRLMPKMLVISLDDDLCIHQIWSERLSSNRYESQEIEHFTFTSVGEFRSWFIDQGILSAAPESVMFLIDYELLDQNITGLDIIEELKISNRAILVTSRYEESKIRARCESLGVRLIPKAIASFVPIDVEMKK